MLRTRWMALLLVAVAAAAVLSACGSSNSDSSSTSGGEETSSSASTDLAPFEKLVTEMEAPVTTWPATAPTEPVKKIEPNKLIIDIALSPEEPASLATAEGVVEAAEAIGWDSKILYGEFSAAKTAAAFEQAIALGADAVVTQGIEPQNFKSSIQKLHDSGAILVTPTATTRSLKNSLRRKSASTPRSPANSRHRKRSSKPAAKVSSRSSTSRNTSFSTTAPKRRRRNSKNAPAVKFCR